MLRAHQYPTQECAPDPGGDQWFEVIGVVTTARNRGLQEAPEPAIYIPYKEGKVPDATFLLKTDVEPLSLARTVREKVRSIGSNLPVTQVRTLEEFLTRFERAYRRFSMALFTILAVVGLLLAATRLYSIVSLCRGTTYARFSIRMALGGQRRQVLQLLAGSVAALITTGTIAGIAISVALSGAIESRGFHPLYVAGCSHGAWGTAH